MDVGSVEELVRRAHARFREDARGKINIGHLISIRQFRNEDHGGEKPDAILASNALPGFYPAVYRKDVSLAVEALGPAPDIDPAGTLAHLILCRQRAKETQGGERAIWRGFRGTHRPPVIKEIKF
jgi:hypothetical protein